MSGYYTFEDEFISPETTSEIFDYGSSTAGLDNSTLNPLFQLPNNTLTKVFVGRRIYQFFIPLLAIFVVIINGINLMSSGLILKNKINPRTTYMLLGNVALCDLLTGMSLGIGAVFPVQYRTHLVCCAGQGIMISSCLASVWSIGLIAVDRFLYITNGLKYMQYLSTKRVWLLIITSWLIGIIPAFLPAMGWDTGLSNNGRICWFVHITPIPIIGLIGIIGLTPIFINCSLYIVILYYAVKKAIQLRKADTGVSEVKGMRISRGTGNAESQKQQMTSKWKAIKIVVFTTGAFIVTWGPFLVCCIIYSLCKSRESCKSIAVLIASPLHMLAFMNSILNPFIYAWWHKPFRDNVVRFLLCKKKRSKPKINPNPRSSLPNNSSMSSSKVTTSTDFEDERL